MLPTSAAPRCSRPCPVPQGEGIGKTLLKRGRQGWCLRTRHHQEVALRGEQGREGPGGRNRHARHSTEPNLCRTGQRQPTARTASTNASAGDRRVSKMVGSVDYARRDKIISAADLLLATEPTFQTNRLDGPFLGLTGRSASPEPVVPGWQLVQPVTEFSRPDVAGASDRWPMAATRSQAAMRKLTLTGLPGTCARVFVCSPDAGGVIGVRPGSRQGSRCRRSARPPGPAAPALPAACRPCASEPQ